MTLTPCQRRVLLDLAMGKSLVREKGRLYFREFPRVTIYGRSVARLSVQGLVSVSGTSVRITNEGVKRAQGLLTEPPRYFRKGTKPPPAPPRPEPQPIQPPLPGCSA